MRTGPICHLCGAVVATVAWVSLDGEAPADGRDEGTDEPDEGPRVKGEGLAEVTDGSTPAAAGGREVGLCPDCLSAARARGRILAPVIPLRPGHRRRRRAPE